MFKPVPLLLVLGLSAACGSKFEPGDGAGGASNGGASAAGASQAGATSAAGQASGGASAGGADNGGSAGEPSAGGRASGGSGGLSTAGAGGAPASGGAAGADCAALKTEYAALVKKARVCDKGSTDECTTTSKSPAIGCGCPTLLNVKSEYTQMALDKYKAIEKGNCNNGPICGIACLPVTSASCAQSTGTGPSEFVCTGVNGGVAN